MTRPPPAPTSPFNRAATLPRRLKLLVWGEFGAGKTTLALQFPRPVVIDLEGGTDLYGDAFEFDVVKASTPDEVMEAVTWLLTHEHPYRTLVVDPVTCYWDALQRKWSDIFLLRNKGTKGHRHEFYDLQPKDWLTIKSELKELVRKLVDLDLNVVVTARQKTKYADGSFMRAVGETFDGEKSLPYLFDVVLRLYRDETGRVLAESVKDRTNALPKDPFECSYPVLEKLLGRENLSREAKPIRLASAEQIRVIQEAIRDLCIPEDRLSARLLAYGAETLEELTSDSASQIIDKLRSAKVRGSAST